MKTSLLIVAAFLLGLSSRAQQAKPAKVNQLWAGYFSTIKLNSRISINSDFQGRTTNWYKQWSQILGRTGVSYKANDKFSFTLGFADFLFFQKGNKVSRNEYRPWQELLISDSYEKIKITHRFRAEQRYFQQALNDELVGKFSFNHRFRYRFDLRYLLWKEHGGEKEIHFQFGNEIHINAGKAIVYNYFDQNRTWIGLFYTLNKSFSFQLQYMNIFQQVANGTLNQINVVRFNIHHTIVL